MQEALADPDLIHLSRVNTLFALGKAQEDAGNYDAAFEAWREGNALKKHQTRYTSEQMQTEFDLQKTHCTKELFERRRKDPGDDIITELLSAADDGDKLSDDELVANIILLFAAGHETTVNMLGNGLLLIG